MYVCNPASNLVDGLDSGVLMSRRGQSDGIGRAKGRISGGLGGKGADAQRRNERTEGLSDLDARHISYGPSKQLVVRKKQ